MKLTQKNQIKASKSGMTLLELTVVILVLLSLISILFIGARAWKKGSDRAGCIMNIRNVQQAVRGHMNMNNTTTVPASTVIYGVAANTTTGTAAVEGYMQEPSCPTGTVTNTTTGVAGTSYTYTTTSSAVGFVFLTCSRATSDGHVPTGTSSW